MKQVKIPVLPGIVLLCILLLPAMGHADWSDLINKFHPSLTLQEDYTTNVDLRSNDPREEWITTISPGIRFSTVRETKPQPGESLQEPRTRDTSGIDLGYRIGLVYYALGTYDNYVSQDAALDAWTALGRNLHVRLKDTFVLSEEPLESDYRTGAPPGSYLPGNLTQRARYYRNILEPSVEYRYGIEDRLSLYYRNNIYNNDSPQLEDSRENYINPRMDHWFNIHNGATLEYGYTAGNFENSPDLQGHMGRGRYTYRFNPQTSVFGDYIFLKRDFESPGVDYEVQNPSLGIVHTFSPSTKANLQMGYFWENPQSGPAQDGLTLNARLTTRTLRTDFGIYLRGGYREDYFTAENLGFTKYYGAWGNINHRLVEKVNVGITGYVGKDKYTSGQEDWLWEVRGTLSYQPIRWLTFTLEALHREDDSNIESADYQEDRGILRITASL